MEKQAFDWLDASPSVNSVDVNRSPFSTISLNFYLVNKCACFGSAIHLEEKYTLCCSWCKTLPMWLTEQEAFLFSPRCVLLGSALLRPKLFWLCIHLGTLHIEHFSLSSTMLDLTYFSSASFTIRCLEMLCLGFVGDSWSAPWNFKACWHRLSEWNETEEKQVL